MVSFVFNFLRFYFANLARFFLIFIFPEFSLERYTSIRIFLIGKSFTNLIW